MQEKKKFQFGNVLTISVAHHLHDVFSSFLAPILPLLIEKLSISYSLAGMLTVFQRIPALANPLIGLVADKLPVRYILIVAPSITSVVMSLLGVAPSYVVLVILLFVAGLSSSLFHVPAPVMVTRVSGNRIGKGMSYFMFGGEMARTVAPIVILGAVSLWGLEGTYKLIPFGIASSILLFIRLRNVKISEEFKKSDKDSTVKKTLKQFLPTFIIIAGIFFFTSVMKGALSAFLPTYLTSKGESLWAGGIALSVLQLAGAAGSFFFGSLSDKIGRRSVLIITVIVSPLLMWLFVAIGGAFTLILLALLGLFLFGITPVTLALVNEIKTDRPSFVNGIYMTINFVFGSLCVPLVGLLADLMGMENAYLLSALLSFGALPFILMLPKKKKE
ncbi:MFS transporter [Bacteroidota bacterium]